MNLSPSSIDRSLHCLAWWRMVVDGVPDDPGQQFTRSGSAAHTLIERYLRGSAPRWKDSSESADAAAWAAYDKWLSWRHLNLPQTIEGDVEQSLTLDLDGVRLRGIVDLALAGGSMLYDWKTGWGTPPSAARYRVSAQPMALALLALCTYRVPTVTVRTVWVRYGIDREYTWDLATWRGLATWVENVARRLEHTTEWVATPGPHCQLCSVASRCPILEKRRRGNGDRLGGPQEAIDAATHAMALRAALNAQVRRLRLWCAVHGTMEVGDKVIGFVPGRHGDEEVARWQGP